MFPWYVDVGLVLTVLAGFCAIWSITGESSSERPPQKTE
jgi:hypothetical protein